MWACSSATYSANFVGPMSFTNIIYSVFSHTWTRVACQYYNNLSFTCPHTKFHCQRLVLLLLFYLAKLFTSSFRVVNGLLCSIARNLPNFYKLIYQLYSDSGGWLQASYLNCSGFKSRLIPWKSQRNEFLVI